MKVNDVQNMSKDQFAKFMFTKGLETKQYNYDIVCDLKIIETSTRQKLNESQDKSNDPITVKYIWYFKKETGSWLFEQPEKTAEQNSDEEYHLTFTVNCDYLHKASFSTIKRVR